MGPSGCLGVRAKGRCGRVGSWPNSSRVRAWHGEEERPDGAGPACRPEKGGGAELGQEKEMGQFELKKKKGRKERFLFSLHII